MRQGWLYGARVEQTSRLWPDSGAGPYRLTLRWGRENGRPRVIGLHLDLDASDGPALTTSLLRDLKLAEIMVEDRERLKAVPQVKRPAEMVIQGMRPSTVRRLHRAADIYLTAWQAGLKPTKEVGRRMNVSPAAAANLVRRAREAGLIPPTSAGVPQG